MAEKLSVLNIIECEQIMDLLKGDKGKSMFMLMMIRICNDKLNQREPAVEKMKLEENIEPELFDLTDDEED